MHMCTCVLLTTTVRQKKKFEAVFIFTADCTFFFANRKSEFKGQGQPHNL